MKSLMKTAKVIPLFKAGDVDTFSNYRPVSLLSQFSKILEKVEKIENCFFVFHSFTLKTWT